MKDQNSKRLIFILFGCLMIFSLQIESLAQDSKISNIPKVINFSGLVTDANDAIIKDGTYNILFSLYPSENSESAVWSELHTNVKIENGEINVQLGGAAIPSSLNISFDRAFYLGIKINGKPEMNPRTELLPAPYSVRTVVAQSVKDNSITSNKIAPLAVTNDKIKSISWNKIKDLPESIFSKPLQSKSNSRLVELPKYWRRYGNYLETGKEFLGTVNDRNLVIKTDSVQRMLFDPYAKVFMGTQTDSVFFEVFGKTTLGNTYVKNKMGVGADFNETTAKLHIKTTGSQQPFRVDNHGVNAFNIKSNGRVEINSQLVGAEDAESGYPLFIQGATQGMAIKLNGDNNSNHNYMSFWDDYGIAGRIEGQSYGEYFLDPKVIAHAVWFAAQNVALGVAIAASTAGLEIPDVINGTAEVIYYLFQLGWEIGHVGVAYKSSSADYAEWLSKINPNESFSPGDIVGVSGGKISKNTSDAEQIMSISSSPIVLGNMPEKGNEKNYEKVAFKGQVPIKVKGIVHAGDYIIPSGLNDGIGVAVEPDLMTAEEFANAVGRAWESNNNDNIRLINTAVGLKMKDLAISIRQSFSSNNKLAGLLNEKNKELESILLQIDKMNNEVKYLKTKILTPNITNESNKMYSLKKN